MTRGATIVLVLVACGCGGAEPEVPVRSAAVAPPRAARPPAPTDAPTTHAPTLPPLPADTVPERLGTPASSLAARPEWAWGGYAPQLEPLLGPQLVPGERALVQDPCAVWSAAAPAAPSGAPIRGGDALVCLAVTDRVESKFAFNLRGVSTTRADLALDARLDPPKPPKPSKAPALEVASQGPDDTGRGCFTLPVVDLDKGWTLAVHAKDRGLILTDADLGTLRLPFDPAKPIAAVGPSFGIECRRVPRADVEARIAEGLRVLDAIVDVLDRSVLFEVESVGWGRAKLLGAMGTVRWVAAWSGWDDPRLRVRLDRLVALEQRLEGEMQAAIVDLAAKAPKGLVALRDEKLSLEAAELSCGDASFLAVGVECALVVRVRNDGAEPRDLPWGEQLAGITVRLLDTHGRRYMLGLVGAREDGKVRALRFGESPRLAPGETTELVARVRSNDLIPHTIFAPRPPPLRSNPAALGPFVLDVWAPRRDRYGPAPQTVLLPVSAR